MVIVSNTLAADRRPMSVLLPDLAEGMAKATVRKADDPRHVTRKELGAALDEARHLLKWSLKDLSREVGRDERQVARWIAGVDCAPFDVLFAVSMLRRPLLIALSRTTRDVEIETVVRIRMEITR